MVKRIHRQLKASLMCHPDSSWLEALPVVLLGIHSIFKEDLQTSSAELLYGEPLRLPGEFITPIPTETSVDPSLFIDRLRIHMNKLRPVPASQHSRSTPFIFKDLETCTFIMLRDDSLWKAFQPPYSGPYRILQRLGKVFVLRIGNKDVRLSVDRIKPLTSFQMTLKLQFQILFQNPT